MTEKDEAEKPQQDVKEGEEAKKDATDKKDAKDEEPELVNSDPSSMPCDRAMCYT